MSSDLADGAFESEAAEAAVAGARVRLVFVLTLMVAAIVALAGSAWLDVAARVDDNRVRTEGETIRNAMTGMLAMGLPMGDFIGFQGVAARVLQSNPSIKAIVIRDRGGAPVLVSPQGASDAAQRPAPQFEAPGDPRRVVVERTGEEWRLAMPVVNRFGPAGSLELVFERSALRELTRNAALAGLAAALLLATGLTVHGLAIANPEFFQSRRDRVAIALTAGGLALALSLAALAGLAAEKSAETAGAYAHSLGSRLGEAVALGISPDDLSGLDEVVQEYRDANGVIGYVALLEGNRVAAATGLPEGAGKHWEYPTGYFDSVYEVRPRRLYTPQYRVAVGIHWQVVARTMAESGAVPAVMAAVVLLVGISLAAAMRVRTD